MGFLGDLGQYLSGLILMTMKIAYPTYASFKAIKTEGKGDDTTWLIYWVVVAVISFIETYIIPFVSWVPFFMLCRLLLYIWLQLPVFNGSVMLFKGYIRPFFEENKATMEEIAGIGGEESRQKALKAKKNFFDTYELIYKSITEGESKLHSE